MCYQITELYTACHCLYYQHAIDKCASYGLPGHDVQKRLILVGYACHTHSSSSSGGGYDSTGSYHHTTGVVPSPKQEAPRHWSDWRSDALKGTELDRKKRQTNDIELEKEESKSVPKVITAKQETTRELLGDSFISSGSHSPDSFDSRYKSQYNKQRTPKKKETQSHQRLLDLATLCLLEQQPTLRRCWSVALANPKHHHDATLEISRQISVYLELLKDCASDPYQFRDALDLISVKSELVTSIVQSSQPLHGYHQDVREKFDTSATNEAKRFDQVYYGSAGSNLEDKRLFLLRGTPIEHLKDDVRNWTTRYTRSISTRPLLSYTTYLRNVSDILLEWTFTLRTKKEQDKIYVKSLSWTCPHCGRRVSDFYSENRQGALDELKTLLADYSELQWRGDLFSATEGKNKREEDADVFSSASTNGRFRGFFHIWAGPAIQNGQTPLPNHEEKQGTKKNDPEKCAASRRRSTETTRPNHNFVLLCIPFMKWGTKAHQPDVCAVESDQSFFNLLRTSYDTYRARTRWSRFKKVKGINFVKFELFRNQLANVCNSSFSPIGVDYEYEQADTEPPIGINLMMHLFENPDHADIFPVLFKRIPKKTRERLQPCPIKGSLLGWGVQFEEAINSLYVFGFGFSGFLISLVISVTYTIVTGDIQGGFGVGAFVLAFTLFCGGTLHSYVG